MTIKADLQKFYNLEAQKYAYTRKKHWAEADLFLSEISNIEKRTINILELWCWWWRFLDQLSKIKNKKINYTWIDMSENLINIAKNEFNKGKNANIKADFIYWDMTDYIKKPKQETFDLVVCIASFQHIPTYKERFFLIKNFYRILNYDWIVIMTNRSFSFRFIKKYYKNIISWFFRNLFKYWKLNIKDIEIPRKSKWTIYKRYYHIFTLKELKNMFTLSWFKEKKLCYLDKDWKESYKMSDAKNSLIITKKSI